MPLLVAVFGVVFRDQICVACRVSKTCDICRPISPLKCRINDSSALHTPFFVVRIETFAGTYDNTILISKGAAGTGGYWGDPKTKPARVVLGKLQNNITPQRPANAGSEVIAAGWRPSLRRSPPVVRPTPAGKDLREMASTKGRRVRRLSRQPRGYHLKTRVRGYPQWFQITIFSKFNLP